MPYLIMEGLFYQNNRFVFFSRYDMHLVLGELMKVTGILPNITRSGKLFIFQH